MRRDLFRPWFASPKKKNPQLTPSMREDFFHPLKTSLKLSFL
jgi:hypothetical protein